MAVGRLYCYLAICNAAFGQYILYPSKKFMKKAVLFLWCITLSGYSFCQDALQRIDSLLQATYKAGEPGASIAVEVNGKTIFQKGYGLANSQTKEKNNVNTNFNIGSITKQFTALSILQLAEKKKLSLSDKLVKYFPGFNKKTGNAITIQQLLTHSSGIVDHYAFVDTNIVKHAVDKDVLEAVKNCDSTYFIPGSQYRYSNTAYCLLGMIIEKVSGVSYANYIKQHIFQPLLMNKSEVLQIGQPIERRAWGYDTIGAGFTKLDADESIFFSTRADGGIYTSVSQYLQWYQGLQKASLLDKTWIEKARSAQFPVNKEKRLSYGYGWFVNEQEQDKVVYHTGSNGGFRAIVFSIPSKNYLIVLFSNRTGIDLENLVLEINGILGIANKSYTKIDSLESFNNSCPIFAPWKEII
jgi:D-alanyl-D-alanine carboxypeptidase